MSLPIIDTLEPLGDFPAVKSKDVSVNDSKRLNDVLEDHEERIAELEAGGGGGGGGTKNYNELVNQPKVNGVTLTGNKSTADLGIIIPTKTSQLQNDSNFLTEHQSLEAYAKKSEIPNVPQWALNASKPIYTKAEVGLGNVSNTSDADKPVSTAMQEALNGKASTDQLSSVNSSVAANTSSIRELNAAQSALSARMDTFASLPSGSTSGNAELLDIRIKNDGTSADSAGAAVREQFDKIEKSAMLATDKTINDSAVEAICNYDANNIPNNEIYSVGLVNATVQNFPAKLGLVMTFGRRKARQNGDVQIFKTAEDELFNRIYWGNKWRNWIKLLDDSSVNEKIKPALMTPNQIINDSTVYEICSDNADNISNNKMYSVGMSTKDVLNFPSKTGFIITFGRNPDSRQNGDIQIFKADSNNLYHRIFWDNKWKEWTQAESHFNLSTLSDNSLKSSRVNITNTNVESICQGDLNNLPVNMVYGIAAGATIANLPFETGGIVYTLGKSNILSSGTLQVAVSNLGAAYSRIYWSNWTAWVPLSGGTSENISDTSVERICSNDANNLRNNVVYGVGLVNATVQNFPALLGNIRTYGKYPSRSVGDVQVFTTSGNVTFTRIYWGTSWSQWESGQGGGGLEAVKVLAIGDSICAGVRNANKGFIGDLGLQYKNAGISGATISNKVTDKKNIPDQLADVSYDPDVIISNGGVNDYYFAAPLGDIPTAPVTKSSAAESLDRDTIMGALQYLFYEMITLYPKAQRFFLLTHKTTAKASSTLSTVVDWTITKNSANYTQTELFDAIKSVCKLYGVKVIDVFSESMINTAFDEYTSDIPYSQDASVTNTEFVDADGIHPLAYGYKRGYVPLVKQALMTATRK